MLHVIAFLKFRHDDLGIQFDYLFLKDCNN